MKWTNQLAMLRESLGKLKEITPNDDSRMLCTLLEKFTDESTILAIAEGVLLEKRIVNVEFLRPADACGEDFMYDAEAPVVKTMSLPRDENAPLEESDTRDSLVEAYQDAPVFS